MSRVRVLIVDDSSLARSFIREVLMTDERIEIIGEAANGAEALSLAEALNPDIISIDITMPVMDGLEAIEMIMAAHPAPILVVTDRGDADTAFKAISKGALEVIKKPDISRDNKKFINTIVALSAIKVIRHIRRNKRLVPPVVTAGEQAVQAEQGKKADQSEQGKKAKQGRNLSPPKQAGKKQHQKLNENLGDRGKAFGSRSKCPYEIAAIGSSTGGPRVLAAILSQLSADFPIPLLVAQHISTGFVKGLVSWLNMLTPLQVVEAVNKQQLEAGKVYFAPSEMHLSVLDRERISVLKKNPSDVFVPSVNLLLNSVAGVFKERSIGIILTGMGSDGASGLLNMFSQGAYTMAQDEKSSAVFGMPKEAVRMGGVKAVYPPGEITARLEQLCRRPSE